MNTFGSELYSKEELIAEMGSAYLCGFTGIGPAVIENSAACLRSWISALKGDSKLLVTAASAAQKAADYIHGPQAALTITTKPRRVREPGLTPTRKRGRTTL
ncbi:MAG: zincin-like metallopeptidase domain-containing protein [Candidatus Acidiferrales bacterium]